jgi:hypothetical protein
MPAALGPLQCSLLGHSFDAINHASHNPKPRECYGARRCLRGLIRDRRICPRLRFSIQRRYFHSLTQRLQFRKTPASDQPMFPQAERLHEHQVQNDVAMHLDVDAFDSHSTRSDADGFRRSA